MTPLSLDWLALTLRLYSPVVGCPNGHSWAHYSPTNVWNSRWCLFNEYGEKVFTLLFQPRSEGFLKPDAALLEVANEWLYHGIGVSGVLGLLSQCVQYEIKGVSRVDLAADFTPDAERMNIIRQLGTGECYVVGKQNRVPWIGRITDKWYPNPWRVGEVPFSQSWGHKTTSVKWKLYYKSKELRDAAKGCGFDKPYIVDLWREAGLDERNAWRLEVSIRSASQFDFMGNKLTFNDVMHKTNALYLSLYNERFQVRRNEGHKDRSNDTPVSLLDVPSVNARFRQHVNGTIAEHNGSLTLLRHLVTDVNTESVMMNEPVRESVFETVEAIIKRDGLEKYFREIVGTEFDDWREWIRVKAYYHGDEFVKPVVMDDGSRMEQAMLESGMINDYREESMKFEDDEVNDDLYRERHERLMRLTQLSNAIDNLRN